MSDTDRQYQDVVDRLAADLLSLSPSELLARPEYGTVEREVNGEEVPVGFWHHAFDYGHHIYFKTSRRLWWFVSRSYINGVVFDEDSPPRLMTLAEAGDYD